MKERVIVTSVIGEKHEAIWALTRPTFERYADRVDADLLVLETNPHNTTAHWTKFALYDILHKLYRRVLWLDSDIIVRADAPNVFDIVPEDKLGIFNEGRYTPRAVAIYEAMQKYHIELPEWDRVSYYNTGVMVVGQEQRYIFNQPIGIKEQLYSFGEQTYLNIRLLQRAATLAIQELPHEYNHMSIMDKLTGVSRLCSYFVHYAGYPLEGLLDIIRDDLHRWEVGDYSCDPVLFLNIGGGLGDQVCAEPVLRYICEKLYPTARLYAISAYPELFSHIDTVVVSSKMPAEKFDAVYEMDLHPDKKTPHKQYALHTMCHPVDYISVTALKRVLPVDDKEIRLPKVLWDKCIGWNDLILVHPGKGWESKTFPVEWWQEVIDGVSMAGYSVGVIGKDLNEDHGVLPVVVPRGSVDFRNHLTTGDLCALISAAPVLISNDSAPIHIAGAFDNYIILIPTCKHYEHLLPYRRGSQNYKTSALYSRLLCDDYNFKPNNVDVHSVTKLVRPIEEYLPEAQGVVRCAINAATQYYGLEPLLVSSKNREENGNEYHVV